MANTFRIKRRVTGVAGAPTTLKSAELAFNEVDSTLYYGKGNDGSNNATSIISIGGGTELSAISVLSTTGILARTGTGAYSTRTITGTSGRVTVTNGDGVSDAPSIDLASSGITAGTYIKVTYDIYGRATSFSSLLAADVTTALTFTPENASSKGVANGYAGLDATGKVPTAQLPSSVLGGMNYQGTWNATTNTPTLVTGTGTKGYYYKVTTAGTTTIDGNTNWTVGDLIIFSGTSWDKVEGGTSDVVSVAGKVGSVTLVPADVVGLGTMATQSADAVAITGGTVASATVVGDITGNAANVTGIVVVANGGTGVATLTGYVKGTGTTAMTASTTIPSTDITGLGTMSIQSASAVAITGGSLDNIIVDGGTF